MNAILIAALMLTPGQPLKAPATAPVSVVTHEYTTDGKVLPDGAMTRRVETENYIVETTRRDVAWYFADLAEKDRAVGHKFLFSTEQEKWTPKTLLRIYTDTAEYKVASNNRVEVPGFAKVDRDQKTYGRIVSRTLTLHYPADLPGDTADDKRKKDLLRYAVVKNVLPHENGHILIPDGTDYSAPRWLDEGLAMSREEEDTQRQHLLTRHEILQANKVAAKGKARKVYTIEEIMGMTDYPEDRQQFYSLALWTCKHFQTQTKGFKAAYRVADLIAAGYTPDRALRTAFGPEVDCAKLQADFDRFYAAEIAKMTRAPSASIFPKR